MNIYEIISAMKYENISLADLAKFSIKHDDIISHTELCLAENSRTLQKGMNWHFSNPYSVILMSVRENAPYADEISNDGKTLIYEGHDAAKDNEKVLDQPYYDARGNLTENGKFANAIDAKNFLEKVRVYEKIKTGIWSFKGIFTLKNYKYIEQNGRKVFKFYLELSGEDFLQSSDDKLANKHDRIIPSAVMREVWARDKGRCAKCGSTKNLCYDHILPYSRGGTSKDANNIQILCEKCNLAKTNHIENGVD